MSVILYNVLCFMFFFFFFNDTATTEIYTLSLHDALPISRAGAPRLGGARVRALRSGTAGRSPVRGTTRLLRSEEHTSELQSPCNLVCRLLLEKKKKNRRHDHHILSRIDEQRHGKMIRRCM